MKNNDYIGRTEVAKAKFRLLRPDLDWSLVVRNAVKAQITLPYRDTLYFLEHWAASLGYLKPLPFEKVSGDTSKRL